MARLLICGDPHNLFDHIVAAYWDVERSFAWLEKCRRLWKNCERKLDTGEQFIVLAFLALLLRRY